MKILKYKYSDRPEGGWDYSEIEFSKTNLLVGESGSGKTKLLNTIFNIGLMVSNSSGSRGSWEIELEINNARYLWKYLNSTGSAIEQESIVILSKNEQVLVERTVNEFIFNKVTLPKLSGNMSAISLLKEEELMQPLFEGIQKVARRNFFSNELERATAFANIPSDVQNKLKLKKDIALVNINYPLSVRLFLLKDFFKDK